LVVQQQLNKRKKSLPMSSNPKLTKKQKDFADDYLIHWVAAKAARKAYNIKPTKDQNVKAAVIWHLNINKPNIQEYIKENAQIAASVIMELLQNKKTPAAVRLNASKDVLDRAWYKPIDRVQSLDIKMNLEDLSPLELLAIIKWW